MKFDLQAAESNPNLPPEYGKSVPYPVAKKDSKHDRIISTTSHDLCASDVLLWLLQLPHDSPYRRSLQRTGEILGRMTWRISKKQSWDSPNVQCSMVITIHLPVFQRSFTVQSQWALGQWTHMFRMTRIVPDTASIFSMCATMDMSDIQQAFDAGLASPFDQTASGITLLHASRMVHAFQNHTDCDHFTGSSS